MMSRCEKAVLVAKKAEAEGIACVFEEWRRDPYVQDENGTDDQRRSRKTYERRL